MYHTFRCFQCLKTSCRKMPTLQHRFVSSRNDDIVNLLTETLNSKNSQYRSAEGDSVNYGVMETQRNSQLAKKGKKRKIKKSRMQCFVPLGSTAFSNFNALDESLKLNLNTKFSSLLPIQEIVLPNSLQNRFDGLYY